MPYTPLRLSAVALLCLTFVAPAGGAPALAAEPAGPPAPVAAVAPAGPAAAVRPHEVPLRASEEAPAADRAAAASAPALTAAAEVAGVTVAGVTWTSGTHAGEVEYRTRTGDRWSPWQHVHAEPGREDETRVGTAPIVLTGTDEVEVRLVPEAAPAALDARLAVVPEGAATAGPAGEAGTTELAAAATGVAVAPSVYSRAVWGADESIMTWEPEDGQVTAAVVHHTAGTNDYTPADVPAILRGIYAYHAITRGWGDIGYNFLVDKFGRTWEGRAGGVLRPVIAAHALGYNARTTGIAVLGDHTATDVASAAVNAVVRVASWKLSLHGVRADGTAVFDGRTLPTILGHRDMPTAATACPGERLHALLPSLRTRATTAQGTLDGSGPWRWDAPGWGYQLGSRSVTYLSPFGLHRVVSSSIGAHHRYLGGGTGVLGYPTAAEATEGPAYWFQQFERGVVYASPRGTFDVRYGPLHAGHQAGGGGRGYLGYPVANQVQDGPGYWHQVFERGVIYSSARGTYAVDDGRIDQLHRSLGGGRGSLGYPTTSTYWAGSEREQRFERGTVRTTGGRAVVVSTSGR